MTVKAIDRHVLFLQGPGSLFFYRLSRSLLNSGIHTSKIHLCPGDRLFWRKGQSASYKDGFESWGDYLTRYIAAHNVTDIALFSDIRPYHRVATRIAKSLDVNVFAFENGYFRPHWITMQLGGVNGRSPFPSNRREIEKLVENLSEKDIQPAYDGKLRPTRYLGDILFHAVNHSFSLTYPKFDGYRSAHPFGEAGGWLRKLRSYRRKGKQSEKVLSEVLTGDRPFFLYPLQLDHDFQLLEDSGFRTISEACESVIASFVAHAPKEALLLVKNHPLDNNMVDRESDIARLTRKFGAEDRIKYVESGHNPSILDRAAGMVTINSTMGTSALHHAVPLCVLGKAVYDIDGLTHKGGLDSFWSAPTVPDMNFFKKFRTALIAHSQVSGSFHDKDISGHAFKKCLEKIAATSYRSVTRTGVSNVPQMAGEVAASPVINPRPAL